MGQIAEDIINGECCALCGQYFVKPPDDNTKYKWEGTTVEIFEHGYPVACEECWEPDCGYQKSTAATL